MTRVYTAYRRIDTPDTFDAVERELWVQIVHHLERFNHETV